jgi:hypothetical protein
VMSDLIYDAAGPVAGWALIENPTDKERRFLGRLGVEIVEAGIAELIGAEEAVTC